MNLHAKSLIHKLDLKPHPEGGFYRETYRAPLQVQSPHHTDVRSAFTSIYFLLDGAQHSAWHRVAADESWFFHLGTDLHIYSLSPDPDGVSSVVEVRTLGVAEKWLGKGIGHLLLEALEERARELGLQQLFCLTFEVDFFARHGFSEVGEDAELVAADVYAELLRSHDEGVAEFLDLARVKPNTLGNTRMLKSL